MRLNQCINTTEFQGCAPQQEILDFITAGTFSVAFVNSYFDFNDYVTPVKQFIDDSLFWDLDARFQNKANFYVQSQQGQLQDSYLQLGQQNNVYFHQVSD